MFIGGSKKHNGSNSTLRTIHLSVFLFLFIIFANAQQHSQTVKGTIVDSDTKSPLRYANIIILGTNPVIGAVSDEHGSFKIEKVPVGRKSFKISYIGYEDLLIPDVMVSSGKETILNIRLREKYYHSDEITVYGNCEKDKPLNDMATVSARTFSIEESNRYAGGFNDLSRMVTAFAGVASLNGETNEIVIRGNSPKGLLWRIEGVEISNPNHFPRGDGSSGGGISIITSDMISNSDFYTGAFPAEYGNALSGVFDLNFRQGNTDKHESALKLGAIGAEATVEGPMDKANRSSYLVNYRYSTLAMLESIGFKLVDNTVVPTFQDISFNFSLRTKKIGTFNIFGLGGISKAGETAEKDSNNWEYPSDKLEEFETHRTAAVGLRNMYVFKNQKTWLHTVALVNLEQSSVFRDSLGNNYQPGRMYDENIYYQFIRLSAKLNHKFNVKHTIRAGFIYSFMGFNLLANKTGTNGSLTKFIDDDGNTGLIQAYANWKYRINERLDLNMGLHSLYFQLNNELTIEPRLGIRQVFASKHSIAYGFGLHGQTEPLSLYYTKFYDESGRYSLANIDLRLAKSMHHVISYDYLINRNHRIKIEMFYQYLYDIPADIDTNSTFSTINSSGGINNYRLNNNGTGYNYGLELTFERFMYKNFYFLTSLSLFNSKYLAPNGITYNTLYNSNIILNCLGGKEFIINKQDNYIFGVNTKFLYTKGNRLTPIDTELSGQSGQTVYIYEKTYMNRTPDFIRWDIGFSFRINKKNYSWVFSLDVQNVLDRKNIYTEYYNHETKQIEYLYALPLIPVFNLKFEF